MLYNICNKCGTPVPQQEKVCTNCGSPMNQEQPQQASEDAQQKAKAAMLQKAKTIAQKRAREAAQQRTKEDAHRPAIIPVVAPDYEDVVEVVVEGNAPQAKQSHQAKPQTQSNEFETELVSSRSFAPAPPPMQAPPVQQAPPPMQPPVNKAFTQAPQFPAPKKSKLPLIILIIALALATLGVGGWAVYHYYFKPRLEGMIPYSTDAENIDSQLESYTTEKTEVSKENTKDGEKQRNDDVKQGSKNGEPWGMTDEEAAQARQNKQTKKNTSAKQKKNNEPWGMTDEEAAQMRKNRRNKPAAGEPWGMTDEEAAQMRQNQQRNKRR